MCIASTENTVHQIRECKIVINDCIKRFGSVKVLFP